MDNENSGDDKKKDKKHRDRRHKSDAHKKSKRGDEVITTGGIGSQKLEEENARLRTELSEMKNKLEHMETRERNKETRITLLMRELEKLESRVLQCQEDCKEWEQIDREKDKTVLSLQQTVVILQRDLDKITEGDEGGKTVVVPKKPNSHPAGINFVGGHTKHEYPPEAPSDSSDSESYSVSSDSEADELPMKTSRNPQQSPVIVASEEKTSPSSSPSSKPPPPSNKSPSPSKQPSASLLTAKQSTALGFDSSTDIFSMMAGGATEGMARILDGKHTDLLPAPQRPQPTIPTKPAPTTSKMAKFGFDSNTDIFSMMARPQQDVLKGDSSSSSSSDSDDEAFRKPTTSVGTPSAPDNTVNEHNGHDAAVIATEVYSPSIQAEGVSLSAPKAVDPAAPQTAATSAPQTAATSAPQTAATAVPQTTATSAPQIAATSTQQVPTTPAPQLAKTTLSPSKNDVVRQSPWGKPTPTPQAQKQAAKPAATPTFKSAQVGSSPTKPVAPSSSDSVQQPPAAASLKPVMSVRKLAAMWEQPPQPSFAKPAGRSPTK